MLPRSLIPPLSRTPLHLSATGKGFNPSQGNQEKEYTEDTEEEDDDCDKRDKAKDKTPEQKTEKRAHEEEEKEEGQEQEEEEETESQESWPASETQHPPFPYLTVFSGTDPELGPQLQEAAARGENWAPPTTSSC